MRFLKVVGFYGTLLSMLLLFAECRKNDYDLSNGVNMEITVGGDSLTIPLGSIKPVVLSSIIDEESVEILEKSENGEYAIRLNDSLQMTITGIRPVSFAIDPFIIDPVEQQIDPVVFDEIVLEPVTSTSEEVEIPRQDLSDFPMPVIDEQVTKEIVVGADIAAPRFGDVEIPFDNLVFEQIEERVPIEIDYDFSKYIELKSVERLKFADAKVTVTFSKTALNEISTELIDSIAELTVIFPTECVLSNPGPDVIIDGNVLRIKNVKLGKNVDVYTTSFVLGEIDFSAIDQSSQRISFVDDVVYTFNYAAKGKVDAGKLSSASDLNLELSLRAEPELDDALIMLNDIDIEGRQGEESFSEEVDGLPDQVDLLKTVEFAQGAELVLKVTDPGIQPLQFKAGQCVVELPSMFAFEQTTPYLVGNTLTIPVDGLFGEHRLAIRSMDVNQPVTDGKITVDGKLSYDLSGIQVASTTMWHTALQAIHPQAVTVTAEVQGLVIENAEFTTKRIRFDLMDEQMDIDIDEFVAEEAEKLYAVGLQTPAGINMQIEVEGLPEEVDSIYFDNAYIQFPKEFVFAAGEVDADNRMSLGNGFRIAEPYLKSVHLQGFDFGAEGCSLEDGTFKYAGKLNLSGKAYINSTTLNTDDLGTIWVKPTVTVDEIQIAEIEGKVNAVIEPVDENIVLDLPDILKNENNNLDIVNPVVTFEVGNTLAIPVEVGLTLTPKLNGTVLADGVVSADMSIAPAEVQGEPNWSRFWLAKTDAGVSDGYIPVKLPNLANLLRTIPDEIAVKATPVVTGDRHKILLGEEDSRIDLNYEVNIPLSFGKDFHLEYQDTIAGLGESLGEILTYVKKLDVVAVVQNDIPLDLTLMLSPMDDNGRPLAGVDFSSEATIHSCNLDGSARESTLTLQLAEKEEGALDYLDALQLKVSASKNATVAGMPLKDTQGFSLSLKVRVPGGLTMDLSKQKEGE